VPIDEIEIQCGANASAGVAAGTPLLTLEDYPNLYQAWGSVPIGINGWQTDEYFGKLRKTFFPLLLTLATSIPPFVPASAWSAFDLLAHRLYYIDYAAVLAGLSSSNPVYCNASYALFRQANPASDTSPLLPVGVWMQGQWYTPADNTAGSAAWTYAKLVCNCIDGANQPQDHLLNTHLQIGPLVTAGLRQFGANHPVSNILSQAVQFNPALISIGFQYVFEPGTTYDELSLLGAIGMHASINRDWGAVPWTARNPLAQIASRGVQNLGGYLYGQDMQSYADAYEPYVAATLANYYPNDAAVAADTRLQAWAKEIGQVTTGGVGGNVYGFPSPITTVATLNSIVTTVLLSVIRHHATNFVGFWEVELALPAVPWRLSCPIPTHKAAITQDFIVSCMPNLVNSQEQISFARSFGRPFAQNYAVLYQPLTALSGTLNQAARNQLGLALLELHDEVSARPSGGVLEYKILDPLVIPVSGMV
jgi:hypothetical protein